MEQVKEFGQVRGFAALTEPFLTCEEETGQEMTAIAAHVLNAQGSFHFSTGESYCYLIYRHLREIDQAAAVPLSLDALQATESGQERSDSAVPRPLPLPLIKR